MLIGLDFIHRLLVRSLKHSAIGRQEPNTHGALALTGFRLDATEHAPPFASGMKFEFILDAVADELSLASSESEDYHSAADDLDYESDDESFASARFYVQVEDSIYPPNGPRRAIDFFEKDLKSNRKEWNEHELVSFHASCVLSHSCHRN